MVNSFVSIMSHLLHCNLLSEGVSSFTHLDALRSSPINDDSLDVPPPAVLESIPDETTPFNDPIT